MICGRKRGTYLSIPLVFLLAVCLPCCSKAPAPQSQAGSGKSASAQREAAPKSGSASDAAPSVAAGRFATFPPVPLAPIGAKVIKGSLILNGSFEQGDDKTIPSWTLKLPEDAHAKLTTDAAADRDRSLEIDMPAGGALDVRQEVATATPGILIMRGFVRAKDLAGPVRLSALDAVRGAQGFYMHSPDTVPSSDAWSIIETRFELPAYVKKLAVSIEHPAPPDTPQTPSSLWFDQCELYYADVPPVLNLVKNPSFEDGANGMDDWRVTPGVNVMHSVPRDAVHGAFSLLVELPDNCNLGISQEVPIQPATEYILRGYIKTEKLVGDAMFEVQHGVGGWKAFSRSTNRVTGTTDWTLASLQFTSPADTDKLILFLRRPNPVAAAATTGKIWFDGCELFKANELPR